MRWASGFATGVVTLVCAELVAWGVIIAAPYREAGVFPFAQLAGRISAG